jgi:hypothetical protein
MILGCQKSSNPTSSSVASETPPQNFERFYKGTWEIQKDSADSTQFYTFQLKLDFDRNLYGWPKVTYGGDSMEVNAAMVYMHTFVFYGDSLKIKSNTEIIVPTFFLDSLVFLKDKLSKNYQFKISKEKLSELPLSNQNGPINVVLAWYVQAGHIQNETSIQEIRNKLYYGTGQSAYFLPLENKIINFPLQ